MRWDLISGVEILAFPDLIGSSYKGFGLTIDFAVNMIFDDMSLDETPDRWIGAYLLDKAEADQGLRVCEAYMKVQNAVGRRAPDTKYVAHSGWTRVVDEARILLKLLYRDNAGYALGNAFANRLE